MFEKRQLYKLFYTLYWKLWNQSLKNRFVCWSLIKCDSEQAMGELNTRCWLTKVCSCAPYQLTSKTIWISGGLSTRPGVGSRVNSHGSSQKSWLGLTNWEWQLVLYLLEIANTCKACINIPAVRLCADRVRCQPEVSIVTEWNVKVLSNSVLAQCKLQNKYY